MIKDVPKNGQTSSSTPYACDHTPISHASDHHWHARTCQSQTNKTALPACLFRQSTRVKMAMSPHPNTPTRGDAWASARAAVKRRQCGRGRDRDVWNDPAGGDGDSSPTLTSLGALRSRITLRSTPSPACCLPCTRRDPRSRTPSSVPRPSPAHSQVYVWWRWGGVGGIGTLAPGALASDPLLVTLANQPAAAACIAACIAQLAWP